MDRKVVFAVPVGSKNYNVNDRYSDEDFKTFLYPSFNDLYDNHNFSKAFTSDVDVEKHDIRKLSVMLWKANVNFIELLFPHRVETNSALYEELVNMRDDIARMNLPYLYDACLGMYNRKMKEFDRDIHYKPERGLVDKEITKEWERKINKHAATGYRILDFLDRFHNTSFEDFGYAIRYQKEDTGRHIILGMRNGAYTHETKLELLEDRLKTVEEIKDNYRKHPLNEKTKSIVGKIIKHYVQKSLSEELINGG